MHGPLVEYGVNNFPSRFHWSSLQPWSSTSIYCVHCQGSVLIKWWMPYLFFSSSGPPGKRKSLYSSPVSRAFRGGSRQVPCIPCLSLQWCCEYYYSPFFQANVHQAVSSSPGAHIKFSIVSQHQDVLKPSTCLNISCSPWLIQNIFICFPMHCVFARVGHTLGVGIYLIKYSRVSHWGVPCDDPKWIECIPCHSTWNTFIVTSSLRVYVRPSIALYYISLLIDQIRNPNVNNRDHLVGRPTTHYVDFQNIWRIWIGVSTNHWQIKNSF